MARKKPVDPVDRLIERAWYRHANGIPVSVMDIPKIFREARALMAAGQSADAAVLALIPVYRVSQ
jgi:hypothetical protein